MDCAERGFAERAAYAQPHQHPGGQATTVIVNGTIVVERAEHAGALPGRVLAGTPAPA